MEFLKAIFGDKALSFDDFVQAINAHNGNEANKAAQIKLGNLGTGEYVGKGKYDALVEELTGVKSERDTANGLIEELKKGNKGNEELQGKVAAYETQMQQMQQQLAETKINAALKVALLAENALDVPYLTFKVNEKLKAEGKALELDENENIKGVDEILAGLKTQHPAQFKSTTQDMKIDPQPLPSGDDRKPAPTTLADALRQTYETNNS